MSEPRIVYLAVAPPSLRAHRSALQAELAKHKDVRVDLGSKSRRLLDEDLVARGFAFAVILVEGTDPGAAVRGLEDEAVLRKAAYQGKLRVFHLVKVGEEAVRHDLSFAGSSSLSSTPISTPSSLVGHFIGDGFVSTNTTATEVQTTAVEEPISLWALWHGEPARKGRTGRLAEDLHRLIASAWALRPEQAAPNDDPNAPALKDFFPVRAGVPFGFLPSTEPKPKEIVDAVLRDPATVRVVLLLVDQEMFDDDQKWEPVVRELQSLEKTHGVHVLPVALREAAWNAGLGLVKVQYVRTEAYPEGVAEVQALYINLLGQVAFLLNQRRRLEVFLSHAKADGQGQQVAEAIHAKTVSRTDIAPFFDLAGIAPGLEFQEVIDKALEHTQVFVAILNGPFPHRRWTTYETISALRRGIPIVVVDATDGRLTRIPPALAGAPLVRWKDAQTSVPHVLTALMETYVQHHLHPKRVERLQEAWRRPKSRCPVTLTVGSSGEGTAVYPDPPRPEVELDIIEQNGSSRHMTVTQYVSFLGGGRRVLRREHGADVRVGLSVSVPDHVTAGFHDPQLQELSLTLASAILDMNGKLAFGHDLRAGGPTRLMAELVSHYAPSKQPREVLQHHVGWPLYRLWDREPVSVVERVKDVSRLKKCMPEGIPALLEKHFVHWSVSGRTSSISAAVVNDLDQAMVKHTERTEELSRLKREIEADRKAFDDLGVDVHHWWAASMTGMRQELVGACDALVAIGGPLVGFSGQLPGVIEEIWLAVGKRRPVYLLGGFGGASRVAHEVMNGGVRDELTLDWQLANNKSYAPLLGRRNGDHAPPWTQVVADLGNPNLRAANGLTPAENQRLAETRCTPEIVYLVSRGLSRLFGTP